MKIIGLTGGIATGKSTVAEMFLELGATIVDADKLARKVVEPGERAYNDIVKRFGKEILSPDDSIDREKLGKIIFNDGSARKDLNGITHPRVFQLMAKEINEAKERGEKLVIVDIPLLYETPAASWVGEVILVYADEKTQLKRLVERDRCDETRAISRIKSQIPIEEKRKKAAYIIDNSGAIEDTHKQVLELWDCLTAQGSRP